MNQSYVKYALRRVLQAVIVILLAYVFTFVVISVLPGDPVTNTLRNPQNGFTEEEITRIVAYYGLDRPVYLQLWESLSRFVVGDFGISLRSGLSVSRLIGEVLPSTLVLASSALPSSSRRRISRAGRGGTSSCATCCRMPPVRCCH